MSVKLLPGVMFLASLTMPAYADNGVLPQGSHVCSQQVQSTAVGFYEASPLTYTVLASSTADGPATEIYRKALPAGTIVSSVRPPQPGTYFFRVCAYNTQATSVNYAYWLGNTETPTGISAAVLGHQGSACSQFSVYGGAPARRIGQSNVPVLWFVEEFDGDGNDLGPGDQVTAATINDVVRPDANRGAAYVELCVSNTSQLTAQITFQLIAQ